MSGNNFILYFLKDDVNIVVGEVFLSSEMQEMITKEVEDRPYSTFVRIKDEELIFNVEIFGRIGFEKSIL